MSEVGDERVEVDLQPRQSAAEAGARPQRGGPRWRSSADRRARRRDRRGRLAGRPGPEAEAAAARLARRHGRQALAGDGQAIGQVRCEHAGIAEPFSCGVARQAMQVHPQARSSNGVRPWASSDPIAPASTSPVPPLARAGFSNGAMATSPSGVAMTVRAPLRTTHWRHAAAASRTAATRASSSAARSPSASGSRPLPARRRANSPACGVSTAGRRSPSHQSSIVASDRSASASRTMGAAVGLVGGDQASDELGGRESGSQARPDDDRVMLVVEDAGERRLRVQLLDVVLGERHRRRLDHLRGEDRLQRFGDGQRDESGSGPPGGPRDQQGGARRSRASRR